MDGRIQPRSGSRSTKRAAPCAADDRDELIARVRWQIADGSYEPERKLVDVLDTLAADLHLRPRRSTPFRCHDHPALPDDRAAFATAFDSPCLSS